VGIELKAALKACKLLIRLNAKNAKYTGIAQLSTHGVHGDGTNEARSYWISTRTSVNFRKS